MDEGIIEYLSWEPSVKDLTKLQLVVDTPCGDLEMVNRFWNQVIPKICGQLKRLDVRVKLIARSRSATDKNEIFSWCLPDNINTTADAGFNFPSLENLTFMSIYNPRTFLERTIEIIGDCPKLRSMDVQVLHESAEKDVISTDQHHQFVDSICKTKTGSWACAEKCTMRIQHCSLEGSTSRNEALLWWCRKSNCWKVSVAQK